MRKLILTVSSLAFACLLVQRARIWDTVIIAIVAGLLLAVLFGPQAKRAGKIRPGTWVAAVVVNAYLARAFCWYWRTSGVLERVAGMLHMGRAALMTCMAVGLAAVALPFVVTLFDWVQRGAEGKALGRVNRWVSSKWAFCAFMLIAAAFIAMLAYVSFSKSIWSDERYTLQLSERSLLETLKFEAAHDVHPPLYHLLFRIAVKITEPFVSGLEVIYVGKLFSVLPYLILWVLCATLVRREHGNFVAGVWAVCAVGMPSLPVYAVEIRMYSWAVLFVSLSFLWMDRVARHGRARDWALFVLFSLCAAYTHHYALLSVAFCYLALLIWCCCNDRGKLRAWFAASAVTVLGYLPWLFTVLRQIHAVNEEFWIPKPDGLLLEECFYFVFGKRPLIPLLAAAAWCALLCLLIRHRAKNWRELAAFTGMSMVPGIWLIGLVVSLLMQPVLYARYLLPPVACLWLGLLIHIDSSQQWRKLKAFAAICLICMCMGEVVPLVNSEIQKRGEAETLLEFYESRSDSTAYIENSSSYDREVVAYLTGDKVYTWDGSANGGESNLKVEELGIRQGGILTKKAEVLDLMEEYDEVYFLVWWDEKGALTSFLEATGLNGAYVGTYMNCKYYALSQGD